MIESSPYSIQIDAEPRYLPDQSRPGRDHYVFAYTITITNTGTIAAQLVSRHWIITDADGKVREVRGQGVVGEQPSLEPGESFRYTSGCDLPTEVGTMHGSYQMVAADGTRFDAPIAAFTLAAPRTLH
ncbi:MAG: Co2+/Mg2+ efflux protein ApaG [Rhodocyclaceae bacterium]|nr:Co2+/Mg2+ efflux protein ApaG [Rhodocyclaceae bacterium]MBX3668934.1 Co2+/Mg2+ efflux protein ApaG [Rhodocyclaceae bacterium]